KPGPEGAHYIDPVVEYPHDAKLLPQSKFPDHGVGVCVIGGYGFPGKKNIPPPGVDGFFVYVLCAVFGVFCTEGARGGERALLKQPKNITSFAQGRDGELYAVAYEGHIFSIAAPASEDAAVDPPKR